MFVLDFLDREIQLTPGGQTLIVFGIANPKLFHEFTPNCDDIIINDKNACLASWIECETIYPIVAITTLTIRGIFT